MIPVAVEGCRARGDPRSGRGTSGFDAGSLRGADLWSTSARCPFGALHRHTLTGRPRVNPGDATHVWLRVSELVASHLRLE